MTDEVKSRLHTYYLVSGWFQVMAFDEYLRWFRKGRRRICGENPYPDDLQPRGRKPSVSKDSESST